MFQTLDSLEVDISVKGTWLRLKWIAPDETGLYVNSKVVAKVISPTISATTETSTMDGFLRTRVSSENGWSHLNVYFQFDGYIGKRFTSVFRGQVMTREQGKGI